MLVSFYNPDFLTLFSSSPLPSSAYYYPHLGVSYFTFLQSPLKLTMAFWNLRPKLPLVHPHRLLPLGRFEGEGTFPIVWKCGIIRSDSVFMSFVVALTPVAIRKIYSLLWNFWTPSAEEYRLLDMKLFNAVLLRKVYLTASPFLGKCLRFC